MKPVLEDLQDQGRVQRRERIAARAYELFQARGREDGRDLEDWLQAEAELLTGLAESTSDETSSETRLPAPRVPRTRRPSAERPLGSA